MAPWQLDYALFAFLQEMMRTKVWHKGDHSQRKSWGGVHSPAHGQEMQLHTTLCQRHKQTPAASSSLRVVEAHQRVGKGPNVWDLVQHVHTQLQADEQHGLRNSNG